MHNTRPADLEVLVGAWEMTARSGERVMSRARSTFRWLGDHSDAFTALYADARGVCRVHRMTFDAGGWTMSSRPGPEFHQRSHGTVADDGETVEGRWEASRDGQSRATDFDVTYRRAD